MLPTGVLGWNSTVQVGATVGAAICSANVNKAGPGNPYGNCVGGIVHNDSGGSTVQLYDGVDATGKLIYQAVLPAGGGYIPVPLGIQLTTGLFLVVSGGTAPVVTVLWK